jgi:hypothetical protein
MECRAGRDNGGGIAARHHVQIDHQADPLQVDRWIRDEVLCPLQALLFAVERDEHDRVAQWTCRHVRRRL